MTSRMVNLDSSKSISPDLTASDSLRKSGQSDIKFKQVLAKTREATSSDSSYKSSNSEREKEDNIKEDNNQTAQKSQIVKPKRASNISTNVENERDEGEIAEGNVAKETATITGITAPNENIQNLQLSEDNQQLPLTLMPQTINDIAEQGNDAEVSLTLNIKPANVDIENQELMFLEAEDTGEIIASSDYESRIRPVKEKDTKSDLVTLESNKLDSETTILKTSESKGHLQTDDSQELKSQIKIADTLEDAEDQASVEDENIPDFVVPINSTTIQPLVQEELAPAESAFELKGKPSLPKIVETSAIKEESDGQHAEVMPEENVVAFNSAQNTQKPEQSRESKIVSKEIQNIFNQTSVDKLLPVDEQVFDQSTDFNEFDSLFSKMENFVSISDGKLTVDFKEIASLPEENIPHRADQITMAVRSAVGRGQSEISLRMYPEDLGAVDVKVEFSEVGKVQSIKFFATKETTLELLQKDYSILERSLKEVINAEDASLSFNLKDGKGEGSDYQPQENFAFNNISEGNGSSERIITANYQANLQIQQDDQVDITV